MAAEITTRLKRPMTLGMRLRVEGWVVRDRGRIVLTEGAVRGADGAVLGEATGKYMPMADGEAWLSEKDFVESPEAIPVDRLFVRG